MIEVMLIDPRAERCQTNAEILREAGLSVTAHTSLPASLKLAQASQIQCLICTFDLIENLLPDVASRLPTIVLAEHATVTQAVACMHRGAANYLALPVTADTLIAAVERASRQPTAQTGHAIENFPLVGSSTQMRTLKEGIQKVAPTDSTVLIQGPSGTGKELVARAIHASSDRAHLPLISINCATVPANLIETELFGMEQYDVAPGSHAGLVNAADGGTLFLDEIAELPAGAQARLLRVMQGENRPIGASTTRQVNVRIIAATHRNLAELTSSERFRQDLYYRLNVVCFQIPPLSVRANDILEIAEWVLKRTSERLNKDGLTFAEEAIDAMRRYHWPGNVRELENAIERAVILSDSASAISQTLLAIEPSDHTAEVLETAGDGETSLEDYFVRFVLDNQDNFTETELAEKLGISRKSLWERRQRLSIPRRKTRKRGPRRDSAVS